MSKMMTLVEAKEQLAKLTASYRARAKVLRVYIRVLETNETEDANDGS